MESRSDILDYERDLWARGVARVAGVDEVGRGPLAGPVVAAAVILAEGVAIDGATDSKALTPERRTEIATEIEARAAAIALGAASVREIDRLNILRATTQAMTRALARLPVTPDHVVVDGLPVRDLGWEHDAVVGGDARVHSIACASIVAKVCRDRLMTLLAARYPDYGWERNMGYATRRHRSALRESGLTPHHRTTFGLLQLELPFADLARD
ncbi:MAG: ribonuclease HII [Gemmatimonadetes bacterium]|nr:ribonuclease HII [Gemmatimonadota bacterium]MCY3610942.1 ribonuclease HII [Gemmatimonadota bacterium]MCY3676488.1 ribonuclease HII [Gemmatimonadota bacterium]